MSILDYTPKADLWTGLAIGAGLLAAPAVSCHGHFVARPVAKELVKTGLRVYEKGNEMVSGFAEGVQDLARVRSAYCIGSAKSSTETSISQQRTKQRSSGEVDLSGISARRPECRRSETQSSAGEVGPLLS